MTSFAVYLNSMFSTDSFETFTWVLDVWDNYVCLFPIETKYGIVLLVATVCAVVTVVPRNSLLTVLELYPIQGWVCIFL